MKKKALWKDIWIEIWNNKARFLALFAIILLGVGFFGGIKATGPNMLDTANQYYADYNLFDLKVLSTFGIEDKDVEVLDEIDGINSIAMQTIDIGMQEEELLLKLYPLQDEKENSSQYAITSGRLPEKSGEISLDANPIFASKFTIGDTIRFNHETVKKESEDDSEEDKEETETEVNPAITLEEQEYKIVGFVNSPIYIDRLNRGNTQVGKGSLDGFGVVSEEDIHGEIYTEMYIQFDSKDKLTAYTDAYEKEIKSKTEEIELALNGRPLERINEIRADGKKEIMSAQNKLQDAKKELQKAEEKLQAGRKELDDGQKEYDQQKQEFDEKIAKAEKEIATQQQTIDNGWAEYQSGLAAWKESAKKYADASTNWKIQKESLLKQMESTVSLEELAKNPIPGEEGEKLSQHIQELLDGEVAIEEAKAQMQAHRQTLATQESQLEEAQQTLDLHIQQSESLKQQIATETQVLDQKRTSANLESRQLQLQNVQQFLSEKHEELTQERKDEMRSVLSGLGEALPLYQPFLQYLEGSLTAEEMLGVAATESREQIALQEEIASAQAAIATKEAQVQELDVEARQATLLENGQVLERAKNKFTEQVKALEDQEQKIQQARNLLLSEVQTAMQGVQQQIAEADVQFTEQGAALEVARAELETANNQLQAGQKELDQGKSELAKQKATGETALGDALKTIQEGEAKYQEGFNEFEEKRVEAEKEIADGQVELDKAMNELIRLDEPVYFVQNRSVNPGYQEYQDNADRMSAIASIFPLFFFMIAALVSFTTITRMVDEQRQQMGTLKGLGYGNLDIAQKFLVYSVIAGIAGTVFGLLLGYNLFPNIIFQAYGSLYNLSEIRIHYYPSYAVIAFLVALLCTIGPAILATTRTLRENPASLMRPKAPKIGKRVFLERVPFIWNRLGFNAKITVRNLVRYKARNSMTVFGVAGCTALILTGFALKDSISGLAETQFGEVMRYQAVVALQPNQTTSELEEYDEFLTNYSEIDSHLHVLQSSYKVEKQGVNLQDVTVFVPESTDKLTEFVRLQDRKKETPYSLTDGGAIISEKLAVLMDIKPGDELVIRDDEEMKYTIPIQSVAENYTGHYLYLTTKLYEDIFSEKYFPNTDLLVYDEDSNWEDGFASKIMDQPQVAVVSFIDTIDRAFADTLESLDVITLVLIASAAALAFVVLYNLTNINVSERIRELSTIKVLGFYDLEVSMYIYRETFILTLLGIFFGFILGSILSGIVLKMVEVDFMLFPITILPLSYLYSALLSMVFSGIVMVIMHGKLKKVDMIEALKSVE